MKRKNISYFVQRTNTKTDWGTVFFLNIVFFFVTRHFYSTNICKLIC